MIWTSSEHCRGEARNCQWLIVWLDCDREGENIAFEVVDVCTEVNSNLNILRARFSALIDRAINVAVQNLVRPNKLFADAVDARQKVAAASGDMRKALCVCRTTVLCLSLWLQVKPAFNRLCPFSELSNKVVVAFYLCLKENFIEELSKAYKRCIENKQVLEAVLVVVCIPYFEEPKLYYENISHLHGILLHLPYERRACQRMHPLWYID